MIHKFLFLIPLLGACLIIKAQETNSFTDSRDGKKYKTVKIGSQTWMAENLAYKTSNGCYSYDSLDSNVKIYGYLYNFEVAKNSCPSGWHLPSDTEWTTLTTFLNGDSLAGCKLKESGINHWKSPNTGANNESGFTALPGGYLSNNGEFYTSELYGYWWTSSESNPYFAWLRYLSSDFSTIGRYDRSKELSFSVRCIKD